ncbi:MAG: hypothetical protein M9950_03855 [Thermomicrobiales bacterium]|nr:hypothetical protein [Thermomicrobiales bacterium]
MNRRQLVGAGVSSIAVAAHSRAFAQEATPEPDAPPVNQVIDLRAREIITMMDGVHPVTLLEALESASVTRADGTPLISLPWQDFGDTDLYNSLGGVFIASEGANLGSPDAEFYGGYIVYESVEIAYHELQRKLNDMDANWTGTGVEGGTTHWYIDSDDLHIRITRIGYVIIIGLGASEFSLIDHLLAVTHNVQ